MDINSANLNARASLLDEGILEKPQASESSNNETEDTSSEVVHLSSTSETIKQLSKAMAKEAPLDMDKVNAVKAKIANGELGILQNSPEGALSLAQKIMDYEQDL